MKPLLRRRNTQNPQRRNLRLEMLEERRLLVYFDDVSFMRPLVLYRFNEAAPGTTAFDSSGHSNDGLFTGGAVRVPGGRTGLPGDAALSVAGNGFISIENADTALQTIADNNTATVTLWQLNDPVNNPRSSTIFSGFDAGGDRQLQAHLTWEDGTVYWDAAGGAGPAQRINRTTSPAELNQIESQWNHWAFVKDGVNDKMSIYLNGQLWHSGNAATANMSDLVSFIIGAEANGTNQHFGLIDDFALFDRVLTPDEINKLATSVDIVWDGEAGDGNWSNPINWAGNANIPDQPNETAIFNTGVGNLNIGANHYQIASIDFVGSFGSNYFVNGTTGSLTLSRINQRGLRAATFNVPVQLTGHNVPNQFSGAFIFTGAATLTFNRDVLVASEHLLIENHASVFFNANITEGAAGRFLRIRNASDFNRQLHTSEVEAFAPGVVPNATGLDSANNLAATALGAHFEWQTSTRQHGADAALVNGLLDTGADTFSIDAGLGVEFIIDLGQRQDVGQARVWQRTDGCCQERLQNYEVAVLADNGSGQPGHVVAARHVTGQVPINSHGTANFSTRIVKAGSGKLSLAGNNQFTGGTSVIGGELNIANTAGSATGSGPVTIGLIEQEARFIRVRNNGDDNRQLHIAEIEAFLAGVTPAPGIDNDNDVALLTKGASFRSLIGPFQHGTTNAPIDGVLQGGGETFSLNPGVANEYLLDLGQERNVGSVRVWQRNDGCCQDRLSDITVSLYADNGSGQPGTLIGSRSFQGQVPTDSFASFVVSPTLTGTATLSGGGTIAGSVTVHPGSTLSPGNSTSEVGTLRMGSLKLLPGAIVNDFFASFGNDTAVITGDVFIEGAIANFSNLSQRPAHLRAFVLINNDGTEAIVGNFAGRPDDTQLLISNRLYQLSYNYNASTNTEGGGNDVALIHLDRAPLAPTIVGAPINLIEGNGLSLLSATGATDPDGDALTYTWDLNGDGIFGDRTGQHISLTWAQLQALGINDGPRTLNIAVRASDGELLSPPSPPAALNLINAAPTLVSVAGPSQAVASSVLAFTFVGADVAADTTLPAKLSFLVDWGDGAPVEVVTGALPTTTTAMHAYSTYGLKIVTVRARDNDGGLSAPISRTIDIVPLMVDATGGLHIGGSDAPERIIISGGSKVGVRMNNVSYGSFNVTGRIVIHGGEGNDTITVASNVGNATQIFGGDGNDYITGGHRADEIHGGPGADRLLGGNNDDILKGGEGHDRLTGGAGNDTLFGDAGNDSLAGDSGNDSLDGGDDHDSLNGGLGNDLLWGKSGNDTMDGAGGADILVGGGGEDTLRGRDGFDLIVGGADVDTLFGGAGDDLLIGGETIHDANESGLRAILAVWSNGALAARIATLGNSTGPGTGQLAQGNIFSEVADVYLGEVGNDWFNIFESDLVKDKKTGDVVRLLL